MISGHPILFSATREFVAKGLQWTQTKCANRAVNEENYYNLLWDDGGAYGKLTEAREMLTANFLFFVGANHGSMVTSMFACFTAE